MIGKMIDIVIKRKLAMLECRVTNYLRSREGEKIVGGLTIIPYIVIGETCEGHLSYT